MKNMYLLAIAILICNSINTKKDESMKEIPKYKNSVKMSHTITVPIEIEKCFSFIINDFSEAYSKTSKGHEYFTIRNGGEMKIGSII
ncbi:MAG: hypothetical protein K8R74_03175, partial [Bacteroidales bacterium]|nr:hypothetical protein [Bacteroidales bacterium]